LLKIHTLRAKILTSLGIAGIASIVASAIIINQILSDQQERYVENRLSVVSIMAHTSIQNLMIHAHSSELREFILDFARKAPLETVRVVRPDGVVSLSSIPEEQSKLFYNSTYLHPDNPFTTYFHVYSGKRLFSSIAPVLQSESCISCHASSGDLIAYINVDVKAEEVDSHIRSSQRWLVGSSVLMILIFVGTAFSVHFRFVKQRTRQLAAGISELAAGNFSYRISTKQKDELDTLAVQINRLGDRLDQMKQDLAKSHQSELERAERMASVGELAASIAHEIRNPVAGISSAMRVLSSELPPDDERAIIFDEIIRQTHRVNRAVNDLLSYARPSTPQLDVGSLNDPIRRSLTLMDAQINSAQVELVLNLEPNLPPVQLDVEQMQQVFVNLIMNAVQAMPSGGNLNIRTVATDSEVIVEVQDTGPGIPKEVLQEIFKPFYTTKHQGTGLGLSICRSIVESHCGRMEARSVLGAGATFSIRLPVHRIEEGNEPL
jgi:signal transduction histidine kinase